MPKLTKKGFTLVELMVVIVIVGILAAVAIPKFTVASHKAKASEFSTVLTSVYSAEHTYEAETGSFSDDLTTIGVSVPTSKWFSYTASTTGSSAFTGNAEVTSSFGNATSGTTATIDQDGNKIANEYLSTYAPNWN